MTKTTYGLYALFAIMTLGCGETSPPLDDAIQRYVDARHDAHRQSCSCYQMLADVSSPDSSHFETEQDCLDAYPQPTEQAVRCIENVLRSGPYNDAGNVDLMECYIDVIEANMACFTSNVADECSVSAMEGCMSPGAASYDLCGLALSAEQEEAIIYCSLE